MACFLLASALLTVVIAALAVQRRWEQAELRHADPAITQARARHPASRQYGQVTSHALEETYLTLDEEDAWLDITARLGAPQGDRRG
jgi:hypothetical protein